MQRVIALFILAQQNVNIKKRFDNRGCVITPCWFLGVFLSMR